MQRFCARPETVLCALGALSRAQYAESHQAKNVSKKEFEHQNNVVRGMLESVLSDVNNDNEKSLGRRIELTHAFHNNRRGGQSNVGRFK